MASILTGSVIGLIGTGISAVSTIIGYAGERAAGRAEQDRLNREGELAVANAQNERAHLSREAQSRKREGELAKSRNRAVQSASGATDPTDITGRRLAETAQYNYDITDAAGRDAYTKGLSARAGYQSSGRAARAGANSSAMGTLFSGIGGAATSMYNLYGAGGPKTASAASFNPNNFGGTSDPVPRPRPLV
jgi:hypothetical protein